MRSRAAFLILCIFLAAVPRMSGADDAETKSLLEADQTLFSLKDASALSMWLEPDFTWTTAGGVTLTHPEVLQGLPQLLLGDQTGKQNETIRQVHIYGDVGTVEQVVGLDYVLRVWVKRPAGWRALVYQEVQAQSAPLPAGRTAAPASCINPCKEVPLQLSSQTEREVIEAYQAVERAAADHDADAWVSHIADEFFAVTSTNEKPWDKATFMAGLAGQKQEGMAPVPLLAARIFPFGDTVVMTSVHQPLNGLPLRVTRVWVRQDGRWVEALCYQTTLTGK